MTLFEKLRIKRLKSHFNEIERIKFYSLLLEYSKAGVDRDTYLRRSQKRYEERNDPRAEIVSDWIQRIEEGFGFAEALSPWVTKEEYIILKTASNKKDGIVLALTKCIKLVQMNMEVNKAIKKVSFTVALYFFILPITIFLVFAIGLIPRVIEMLEMNIDDNTFVKYVMAVKVGLGYFLVVFFAGLYFLKKMIISPPSNFRIKFLDRIIPFSLFRIYQSSKFLVAYATFMGAGLNMSEILKEFMGMKNSWLSFYVSQMIYKHDSGQFTTAEVLKTKNFFDMEVEDKLDDYAEANKLEDEIEMVGDSLIRELMVVLDTINSKAVFFGKLLFLTVTIVLLGGFMLMITSLV